MMGKIILPYYPAKKEKTLIKGEKNNSKAAEKLSLIWLILPFIWLNLKRSTAGFSRVI